MFEVSCVPSRHPILPGAPSRAVPAPTQAPLTPGSMLCLCDLRWRQRFQPQNLRDLSLNDSQGGGSVLGFTPSDSWSQ